MGIALDNEYLSQIEALKIKTKKKYRKHKVIDAKEVIKRIKSIRNRKLKLSYEMMLATGLRVSELAQITYDDFLFSDDEKLKFCFIGKGGKAETVSLIKEEYSKLFNDFSKLINTDKPKPKQKIFYSAIYLQTNAKKLGFRCHDLRRIYAKCKYRKTKSKREVMKGLRHSSIKSTNIYLRSKISLNFSKKAEFSEKTKKAENAKKAEKTKKKG